MKPEDSMMDDERLSALRAEFLSYEGDDAVRIHGRLLGMACAVERKNKHPYEMADRLIAELRESTGPEIA